MFICQFSSCSVHLSICVSISPTICPSQSVCHSISICVHPIFCPSHTDDVVFQVVIPVHFFDVEVKDEPVVGGEALLELKHVVRAEVPTVGGEELQAARRLRQTVLKADEFRLPTHQSQAQIQHVRGQNLWGEGGIVEREMARDGEEWWRKARKGKNNECI